MKIKYLLFLLLLACDPPTIPPSPTPTTTTTLEAPAPIGEIALSKQPLALNKRPFDYKLDSNGMGHLIVGEKGSFRYQTFKGVWSDPVLIKDGNSIPISYQTTDARFRTPHIAINGEGPMIVWGEKASDGLRVSVKGMSFWSSPKRILGQAWIENLALDSDGLQTYLAAIDVNGIMKVLRYQDADFVAFGQATQINKEVSSYSGFSEVWFFSRFRDAYLYPVHNLTGPIVIPGASMPQGVVLGSKDYHVAYLVGASKKLNGIPYYWPDKVIYKSLSKEIVVHYFPTPSDSELLAQSTTNAKWLDVCGQAALTVLGGSPTLFYDYKDELFMAKIKGSTVTTQSLGKGECPLVKETGVSAQLLAQGGSMWNITIQK